MASETIRVFVAVELPAAQRAAIGALRARVEREWKGVRWVGPDQLHLTLAFLGDVGVQAVPALRRGLTLGVGEVEGFELEVRGVGAFPDAGRPRVVWAGIEGSGLEALHGLRECVARACREAHCTPADDRFRPHVTLGRFPMRGPKRVARGLELEALSDWSGGTFRVDRVSVIASELRAQGPTYSHLSRFGLKGSGTPADA
jgi:2'-5' RNA ligase